MQDIYVNMQDIYANMQDNYVNLQHLKFMKIGHSLLIDLNLFKLPWDDL
jgi:hypothetical protein